MLVSLFWFSCILPFVRTYNTTQISLTPSAFFFTLSVLLCPDCPGFAFCFLLYNTHNTNIHAPGGIRTRNPKKRSASNHRLRPLGHWVCLNLKTLYRESNPRSSACSAVPRPTALPLSSALHWVFKVRNFVAADELECAGCLAATTHSTSCRLITRTSRQNRHSSLPTHFPSSGLFSFLSLHHRFLSSRLGLPVFLLPVLTGVICQNTCSGYCLSFFGLNQLIIGCVCIIYNRHM